MSDLLERYYNSCAVAPVPETLFSVNLVREARLRILRPCWGALAGAIAVLGAIYTPSPDLDLARAQADWAIQRLSQAQLREDGRWAR